MTAAHFIYIPMMIAVGVVLGFFFGSRAAKDAFALEQRKEEKRAAAKAARAAKAGAPPADEPPAKA